MRQIIFVLSLLLLAGCGANNEAADKDRQNMVQVKNSTIQEVDRETGQEISRHLVEIATDIPNVKDATAVVLGNYAIVGVDVKSNIERSQVGSIKYAVAEALKNDPHGARAAVIADPDMNARLKEISQDIQDGKPIQGIMNELADIAGRLMPEIPADIVDPHPKNATEEPKTNLNKSEEQKLEQKQQEGSKHHKENK